MDPERCTSPPKQTVDATLRQVRQLAEGRRLFYLHHRRNGPPAGHRRSGTGRSAPIGCLREIMLTEVVTVRVQIPEEEVAQAPRDHVLMVPVVDGEGRFTGAITVDDVLDVVEAQATEDISTASPTCPSRRASSPPCARCACVCLGSGQSRRRLPCRLRRQPVPGDDREIVVLAVHADRRRHGRQRGPDLHANGARLALANGPASRGRRAVAADAVGR